jgi:hypothetical protein
MRVTFPFNGMQALRQAAECEFGQNVAGYIGSMWNG